MLWIALYLPQLPLQLAQRAQQTIAPCVVVDGPALRPLVCCANHAARELGVLPGMPVAAARALAGDFIVLQRDQALDPLPLELLGWPDEIMKPLQTLGIRCIGQCLELPRDGFTRRFGHEQQLMLDKAVGRMPDPRPCFVLPDKFASRIEFGFEVNDALMLLFPLKRLLQELAGFLRGRGAGVQEWYLVLEHMNKGRTHITIRVAAPECSTEHFLMLARERLTQLALIGPVLALGITAEQLLAFEESNRSFIPDPRTRAIGWGHLVDKLTTRLGNDKVYRLCAVDDHRPEHGWQQSSAAAVKQPVVPRIAAPRPLFLLRTPRALSTENDHPLCQGRLRFLAGPERIESGWWDGDPARRDYFVARNPKGATFWIYREHRCRPLWYLHGIFA